MAVFDVLLPVRNGIAFFAASLDSICRQDFPDWRLLVLDHGSTDGSLELARRYAEADPRVVVHSFPQAKGLSGLLNHGLELADCAFVLRQDADDVSYPNRMSTLAKAFESDAALVLAGSLGDVIDGTGRRIGALDMPVGEHAMAAAALFRTPAAHPTVAMRFEAIKRLGVSYGADFIGAVPADRRLSVPGLAEDYFLFGQLALVARCINIDHKLIQYRWHGGNVAAVKYVEQAEVALGISRYLAESLAILHANSTFDPAPLCNHGETLFEIPGRNEFSPEHAAASALLHSAFADSPPLRRELAFRKVISHRAAFEMALRYAGFASFHGRHPMESRTVASWLTRRFRRGNILTLTGAGLRR